MLYFVYFVFWYVLLALKKWVINMGYKNLHFFCFILGFFLIWLGFCFVLRFFGVFFEI